MKRFFLSVVLLLPLLAGAQEMVQGLPKDVYYLMPSFGEGLIYFRGQIPAQGQLNICAVDNTIRYIGNDGNELVAQQADNIVRVLIDTVSFLYYDKEFYRMHPVSSDMGVAVRRDVKIQRDVKQGAYGTTSQTSSTREYGTLYAEGAVYQLNSGKVYPYEVSEKLFLYKGGDVYTITKKNLKKLFPEKKEEIEARFKAGTPLPETESDAAAFLASWL